MEERFRESCCDLHVFPKILSASESLLHRLGEKAPSTVEHCKILSVKVRIPHQTYIYRVGLPYLQSSLLLIILIRLWYEKTPRCIDYVQFHSAAFLGLVNFALGLLVTLKNRGISSSDFAAVTLPDIESLM